MGRSTTPKYALEMDGVTSASWRVRPPAGGGKGQGTPTDANLERHVLAYIDSLKIGGVNQHVLLALGHIPVPNWARIVRNDGSRAVVASWKAPPFFVF